MASVYDKAGKWYLRWKGPDGSWRDQVSTARSKTEARRLADELERRAERQRLGLEPLPTDSSMTLGHLCEWWLRERERGHFGGFLRRGRGIVRSRKRPIAQWRVQS